MIDAVRDRGVEAVLEIAERFDRVRPESIRVPHAALAEARVAGSVGWAPISVMRGFPAALADADQAMYAAKRARRALHEAAQTKAL